MFKTFLILVVLTSLSVAQDYHAKQKMLDLDEDVLQQMAPDMNMQSLTKKFYNKSVDQIAKMVRGSGNKANVLPGDFYLSKNKIRVDMQIEGKKATYIFRLDKDKMYSIDNDKKEFLEMDLKQMRRLQKNVRGQVENAMSQMGDALKNLTPEQRAQMESMLGTSKKQPIAINATGKTLVINGFKSSEYRVEGPKKMEQLWISTSHPQMRRLFEQMQDAFPDDQDNEKQIWNKIKKGWPVRDITISRGSYGPTALLTISEITSIKKTHFSAGFFTPPAGYKKTTMQNMINDHMRYK